MMRGSFRWMERSTNRISKQLTRRGLSRFIRTELAALTPGQHVMSVGSGGEVGDLVKAFCEAGGLSLVQVDIDADREPNVVADLCDLPFDAEAFDAILVLEVMEHVSTPALALAEVKRVLKPKGKLVWSTPFLFPIHDEPFDYFRYTRFGILKLLEDFEQVVISEKMGARLTILALRCRLAREFRRGLAPLGLLLACRFWLEAPLAEALDRHVRRRGAPMGYFATANKVAAGGR